MIQSCIERMRRQSCGGCERRDRCGFHWKPRAERGSGAWDRSPFGLFLREVGKAIRKEMRPRGSDFRRKVERHVEPLLASGAVRIDEVARALGCSRQTLYRRLKAEGATFVALVDGVRRRLALRLLRDEGVSVKETAYRLGFSDPAAFSRAFKRWTGESPSAARGV